MRITRMITGPDGKNCFEQIEVQPESSGSGTEAILLPHTTKARITTLLPDFNVKRSPTPHHHKRQYIVILQGAMEVSLLNGDKRVIGAGEIFCTDESSGEAHGTTISGGPRVALYIDFDDQE